MTRARALVKRLRHPALLVLLALAGGGVARGAWRGHTVRAGLDARFRDATAALAEGRAERVPELAPRPSEATWLDAPARARWDALEVRAAAVRRDGSGLVELAERARAAVLADEEAACFAARALANGGDDASADALAGAWSPRGAHPEWWLALSADREIAHGQLDRARALLARARLPGAADGSRLCRLALLWLRDDPARAWRLLEDGVRVAPGRADLRLVRAQILESAGRTSAAEAELDAAVAAAPADLAALDQLAEFHRRAGRFGRAVEIWRRAAQPPPWLARKIAFHAAVALGEGPMTTCAGAASSPEARWLAALDALRRADWAAARDGLAGDHGSMRALAPHLYAALVWLVERRLTTGPARDRIYLDAVPGVAPHSVFERLATLPSAPATDQATLTAALDGAAGPALLLIAAGWRGAGLALLPRGQLCGLPGWAMYMVAETLRLAGRVDDALRALAGSRPDGLVELARAQALISSGRPADALPVLVVVARGNDAAAHHARLLLEACRRPAAGGAL